MKAIHLKTTKLLHWIYTTKQKKEHNKDKRAPCANANNKGGWARCPPTPALAAYGRGHEARHPSLSCLSLNLRGLGLQWWFAPLQSPNQLGVALLLLILNQRAHKTAPNNHPNTKGPCSMLVSNGLRTLYQGACCGTGSENCTQTPQDHPTSRTTTDSENCTQEALGTCGSGSENCSPHHRVVYATKHQTKHGGVNREHQCF